MRLFRIVVLLELVTVAWGCTLGGRSTVDAPAPAAQIVAVRESELDDKLTDGYAALAYQSLRLGDTRLTTRLLV